MSRGVLLLLLQRLPRSLHTAAPLSASLLHPRPSGGTVSSDSQAAATNADAAATDAAAVARQSQQSSASATGNQFLGFLYFSPVAPLGSHGNPPSRIMFIEMHMQRSGRFGDTFWRWARFWEGSLNNCEHVSASYERAYRQNHNYAHFGQRLLGRWDKRNRCIQFLWYNL